MAGIPLQTTRGGVVVDHHRQLNYMLEVSSYFGWNEIRTGNCNARTDSSADTDLAR